jgi:flagellar basal-body rod protein FlgG
MPIGVYAAALGSQEQQKRLEVISNNLANTGTAGYKKDMVRFEDFLVETSSPLLEQGPLRSTGHPLDIALSGEGYLRVDSDQGTLYSRAGNLTLNRDGVLVTQEGWPVLGKSGPIQISGSSSTLRVNPDGTVFDGNQNIDSLDLVRFPEKTALVKVQNGYFKTASDTEESVEAETCTVHQGSLEQANFNVVEEMSQMIDTLRNFEAYQKVLKAFDEIDAQVINKVATP